MKLIICENEMLQSTNVLIERYLNNQNVVLRGLNAVINFVIAMFNKIKMAFKKIFKSRHIDNSVVLKVPNTPDSKKFIKALENATQLFSNSRDFTGDTDRYKDSIRKIDSKINFLEIRSFSTYTGSAIRTAYTLFLEFQKDFERLLNILREEHRKTGYRNSDEIEISQNGMMGYEYDDRDLSVSMKDRALTLVKMTSVFYTTMNAINNEYHKEMGDGGIR